MPGIITMDNAPRIATQVFYAYTINAGGKDIGTLQEFGVNTTRRIERVREIMSSQGSHVKQMVPGTMDVNLTLNRIELYGDQSLLRLQPWAPERTGLPSIEDQLTSFNISEFVRDPQNGTTDITHYNDCWFEQLGKSVAINATTIVARATVQVGTVSAEYDT